MLGTVILIQVLVIWFSEAVNLGKNAGDIEELKERTKVLIGE